MNAALALCGNFSATCEQVNLTQYGLLSANCYSDSSETWKSSELSLNYCYENKGGLMVEQNMGLAFETCRGRLDGSKGERMRVACEWQRISTAGRLG
ncbi:hypothetical protein ASPBRDRAFT_49514 [Aspergillus brasiliensis CBS 101740]|uniref:Cyanovirin-N domain-containing protein n=1 Tax=Aspergillus brasiliensis (strain CBS 101740 / IMI 381727 / IBT 21946) TaxID=767769 RepID=A0A1L9U236_ASPBC|nr:hypothetical protein ASPBRDRAFT_49514 [Aspergillus brasiliensis CBS 101740]